MKTADILPWTDWEYAISSNGNRFHSGLYLDRPTTRDDIEERILNAAAHLAVVMGIPWNPFNINLVFRPIL